jgi:DNA-binding NtrC family response regulator
LEQSILVVEDDKTFNSLLKKQLQAMGYHASGAHTREEAKQVLEKFPADLVILDLNLPDVEGNEFVYEMAEEYPVIVLTAYGSIQDAVRAMRAGVSDYLAKPVNLDELEIVVERVLDNAVLELDKQLCNREKEARFAPYIVGSSKALQKVMGLIDAVAPSNMTVLIEGESGTGKELVAHEIHKRSTRSNSNFVALDCCSLQESLFESELFGHEKGAFTGADTQKRGLIEIAKGGTLFLDEIGEIGPAIQAKLLRVLETGQFRRLGGNKDLHADIRVVAATNKRLAEETGEGDFRSDLYYRLSAFILPVPSLRDRREDIPALVEHFLNHHSFSRRVSKNVSKKAMEQLVAYDWPGNVRELRNMVERAIILSGDSKLLKPVHFTLRGEQAARDVHLDFNHEPSLEEIEKTYLKQLLKKYSGHRSKIADVLGVSERTTYRLLQKYDLQNET